MLTPPVLSWHHVNMEPVNVVTLVGLIGSAIGYLFTQFDQRSIRTRLKNDMKLLEMAPSGSAARASLEALVDKEAERLNHRSALSGYRLFPGGLSTLLTGCFLFGVAYAVRYCAFHYFYSSVTEYVLNDGGGGYQDNNAGNWITGTTYSLQTLAAAILVLGISIIILSIFVQLRRKARTRFIAHRRSIAAPDPRVDLEEIGQV
jgi:hypothetical protein